MGTMKGGKEDEKSMRPMFPRVHVNDTDKGGPKAPPRNKMALYEQLSIPSQKFSTAALPPQKPSSVVPSALSIQGGTLERTAYSPFYLPHSTTTSSADKPYCLSSDGKSIEIRGLEFERYTGHVDYRTCATRSGADGSTFNVHELMSGKISFKRKYNDDDDDDDDFRVPTLTQSEVALHCKDTPLVEVNRPAPFGATNVQNSTTLDSSIHVLSSSRKLIHEANVCGKLLKKHERIHGVQESGGTVSSKEHGNGFLNNPEAGEMLADRSKISLAHSDRVAESNMHFLNRAGYQSSMMGNESLHSDSIVAHESLNDSNFLENRNASKTRSQLCSGASYGCSQGNNDKTNVSEESKDAERSGEVSETSMLDSISGIDISPDDVVGVIGQKQFWKARRAIVNQQRVFAIQVFELHRLIKVQKLFAASPNLLLKDSHITRIQEKNCRKSLPIASSSQNADPLVVKAASPPDNSMPMPNPWFFPQPPANQWLIPIMSPSEGLIYKPYAGPCPPTTTGFIVPLSLPSVSGYFPPPYGGDMTVQKKSLSGSSLPKNKESRDSEAACRALGEGRVVLPLFPIPPPSPEGHQLTNVIKVVPHNARSATESAARIFRSIQKERGSSKQLDL